ncbi:DNA gyrase inhibitor YacG [Legionella cherrii]|uniref:DNA gyrase inhibitor YacG n=1 Tax=Legionella cherrii TaxID=28084 RepID=A0ABY6T6C9_9GAMM|nr:DNA gyrase inhibitor YacG [Legionella cherrii]VEB35677.1 DNA gyrase inhibitor YacG [Legionella cherrii]
MNNHQKIICPKCGKQNTWYPENPFKPFCSDRCKLIDLGEWASENRTIPGKPMDMEFINSTNEDGGNDYT